MGKLQKYNKNITKKSQEISSFQAGDQKAAMNRRESMRNTRHKNPNDQQIKHRVGTVSKNTLMDGFNQFHGANLILKPCIL